MKIQKYTQQDLDNVKASFTAEDAVQLYRIKKKGKSILCPNPDHNDAHYGSCNMTKQGDYHCFVCKKTWSGIDIIMFQDGKPFIEAVEQAASLGGISLAPTEEWVREQNKWFTRKGINPGVPVKKTYPRLSREDAELIGLPYGKNSILIPVREVTDRNGRGVYRQSTVTGNIPGPDEEDPLFQCETLPNPSFTLSQEDPVAYAWLVVTHIDQKLKNLSGWAKLAERDGLNETVNEVHRLINHLKKTRKIYAKALRA